MALMVHPENGGTAAVTTPEAFELIHKDKGFRLLTDDEAAAYDAQRVLDETPGIEQLLDPVVEARQAGDADALTAGYASRTKSDLVDLAGTRGVDSSGNKDELVARLVASDLDPTAGTVDEVTPSA